MCGPTRAAMVATIFFHSVISKSRNHHFIIFFKISLSLENKLLYQNNIILKNIHFQYKVVSSLLIIPHRPFV